MVLSSVIKDCNRKQNIFIWSSLISTIRDCFGFILCNGRIAFVLVCLHFYFEGLACVICFSSALWGVCACFIYVFYLKDFGLVLFACTMSSGECFEDALLSQQDMLQHETY